MPTLPRNMASTSQPAAVLGSTLQNTFAAGNRVLDILEETQVEEGLEQLEAGWGQLESWKSSWTSSMPCRTPPTSPAATAAAVPPTPNALKRAAYPQSPRESKMMFHTGVP